MTSYQQNINGGKELEGSLPQGSAWRTVSFLALSLFTFSGTGCSTERPQTVKDGDLTALKAENDKYAKTSPWDGNAGGYLCIANLLANKDISKLNDLYQGISGTGSATAHLALLSA